jgi:hypothetical protein
MKNTNGKVRRSSTWDLNTPEALAEFREAAKEFIAKGTRSKKAALKVLVDAGIYDKSGRLHKNYRS